MLAIDVRAGLSRERSVATNPLQPFFWAKSRRSWVWVLKRWLHFVCRETVAGLPYRFAHAQQSSNRVLDDVVDDIPGGVVDPAGFAHIGLFFYLGLPPGRQADDTAQELLVDLPQDLDRDLVEHIGAGIVGAFDHLAQDLVIDLQGGREGVGLAGLRFFLVEVEQTRIVFLVGFLEEF